MTGNLVEYVRFVEVQQRRARVAAELRQPLDVLVAPAGTAAASDQSLDGDESPATVDASTPKR
jgi:hypothetical protein